VEAQNAGGVG